MMTSKASVIAGYGQVGSAVYELLESQYTVHITEQTWETVTSGEIECLHICFPWSDIFCDYVRQMQSRFFPKWTVVHSTVPVGTCTKLSAYHVPIRGVHPRLVESLKTFVTYLAPENEALKEYLELAGFYISSVQCSENTEAAKLWCTTALGWMVILEKEIHRFCQQKNLDFDFVYRQWTETYNQGYQTLGMEYVARPILRHMEGPIGGHCVIPNLDILGHGLVEQTIKKANEELCRAESA